MFLCIILTVVCITVPVMASEADESASSQTAAETSVADGDAEQEEHEEGASRYAVLKNGEESAWSQLQDEINKGGTVVLMQDIVASDFDTALTVPSGTSVLLYLNKHTISRALTSATEGGSVIVNNGDLTVTGSGTITGGYTTGNGGGILNNGTLTIETATITGNAADGKGG